MKFKGHTILIICLMMTVAFGCAYTAEAASKSKPEPLPSVKELSCTGTTINSAVVKWSKVKKAKSYRIYLCKPGGSYNRIKTINSGDTLKYKVKNLVNGYTYKLKVTACRKSDGKDPGKASAAVSIPIYKIATYKIGADSKPYNNKYTSYCYYNSKTRSYYTIRSYMELFEKCGGGTLVLKAGKYKLTNTIFVPSNVNITFNDGVVINKQLDTGVSQKASRSFFQLAAPSKANVTGAYGGYKGVHDVTFRGKGKVIFDVKYQDKGNCILAGHNKNITIRNITFRHVDEGHFIELDASRNVEIFNCTFDGITDLKDDGGDRNLREAINLDTPDKLTGGFNVCWTKYDCTANRDVSIHDCTFENMPRAVGTHNYSYGHPHQNIEIRKCNIRNVTSCGIGALYWENSRISGNVIKGSIKCVENSKLAIIGYGLKNCRIYDNVFDTFYCPMRIKAYQKNYSDTEECLEIECEFSDSMIADIKNNTCLNLTKDKVTLLESLDTKAFTVRIIN